MIFELLGSTTTPRIAHDGARDYPFPLATAAWALLTAKSEEQLAKNLFNFVEVAARFVGIINLSALRSDRATYLEARRALGGSDGKPSAHFKTATLGSWVILDAALAKSLRRLSDAQRSSLFKLDSPERIAPLISKDLQRLLREANLLRINWVGHDGAVGRKELQQRLRRLLDVVISFDVLTRPVWDGWHLVRAGTGGYRSQTYHYQFEIMRGTRYPFVPGTGDFVAPLEQDALYLWEEGKAEALRLLPLVRLMPTSDDFTEACYFYDRIDQGRTRWLSYHFGGTELPLQPLDPEVASVIDDLDEPDAAARVDPEEYLDP